MSKLLVLANEFPFGTWEPFLETEEKYYTSFDKIWIAALQLRKEHTKTKREIKSGATVIPVSFRTRLFYLINSISALGDKELYREISELKRAGRLCLARVVDLFVFLSRAHHEARVIDQALKDEDKNDIILYSYRFEYQPYVAILLRKKWKHRNRIVSRAHGYDMFEERHTNNYIPLRKTILNTLDYVFPCSKFGADYLKEKYGEVKATVDCKYLGTVDHGVRSPSAKIPFRIVSCSTVVEVKRLEKIVEALSMIDDIDIEWTHYGDGPLLENLKKMASEKLGKNIKAHFPGNVSNTELLQLYRSEDYHVFLNVSYSEGLPVSIMEAMSFGIPCIATDVGGTCEIVSDRNGLLISRDAVETVLIDAIRKYYIMNMEDYNQYRKNARSIWCMQFNADDNYMSFVSELLQL